VIQAFCTRADAGISDFEYRDMARKVGPVVSSDSQMTVDARLARRSRPKLGAFPLRIPVFPGDRAVIIPPPLVMT
jgi:hypothetical protein